MGEELKNRKVSIKFYDHGHINPVLKDFLVHDQMNKFDKPTGYAWFFYKSTEAEWDALYDKLLKHGASFKVIDIEVVNYDAV